MHISKKIRVLREEKEEAEEEEQEEIGLDKRHIFMGQNPSDGTA